MNETRCCASHDCRLKSKLKCRLLQPEVMTRELPALFLLLFLLPPSLPPPSSSFSSSSLSREPRSFFLSLSLALFSFFLLSHQPPTLREEEGGRERKTAESPPRLDTFFFKSYYTCNIYKYKNTCIDSRVVGCVWARRTYLWLDCEFATITSEAETMKKLELWSAQKSFASLISNRGERGRERERERLSVGKRETRGRSSGRVTCVGQINMLIFDARTLKVRKTIATVGVGKKFRAITTTGRKSNEYNFSAGRSSYIK